MLSAVFSKAQVWTQHYIHKRSRAFARVTMPAMQAFGLRLHLSTDDMPIPCMLGALFQATWIGLIAAAFVKQEAQFNGAWRSFECAALSVLACCLVCFLVLAIASAQGKHCCDTWQFAA